MNFAFFISMNFNVFKFFQVTKILMLVLGLKSFDELENYI